MTAPLRKEIVLERKLQRLGLELNYQRGMAKRLMRAGGLNVEGVVEEFLTILRKEAAFRDAFRPVELASLPPLSVPPIGVDHKEIAALAWSDWHLAEKVKWSDSNGVNSYDSTICANRFWETVQKEKTIIKLHQSMYPIEQIWISILGDMINGSIHEELKLTNDLSDPAAAVLAARLLVMGIRELKTLGIPIVADCVIGNHPRMTAKMPTKTQAHTSYDWMLYEMVHDAFDGDPQVTIRVHTGQMEIVQKYNWRYVIEHGIDWKNGDEEHMEDKIRALFDDPIYREATGLKGTAFDQIVIGNLHKPAFLERTIKNGSLTGQNELGQSWRLKPIKAQQLMWGISKRHVRTWQYQVDVTHIKDAKDNNPFVKYTRGYMQRHGR